jgi:hypothetical protein
MAPRRSSIVTKAKLLMQVDLAGFSGWFVEAESRPAAALAVSRLADQVTTTLRVCGFGLLFWAGDGGVFTKDAVGLPNFDCGVDAARAAYSVFSSWRKERPDRRQLELRVSLHSAYPVYTHVKHAYWFSEDINCFLKHEREIARPGVIAVTDQFRLNLSAAMTAVFPASTREQVGLESSSGELLVKFVYYSVRDAAA